jgi:hypothetical protein
MGLQSFGWADGPGGRPLADGPGRGVRPADRDPDQWTERPSAIQPTVGAGDRRLDGRSPCRPPCCLSGGMVDGMPSGGCPVDADVDVQTRDNPACPVIRNPRSSSIYDSINLKISSNHIWVIGYFGEPLTYLEFTIFSFDFLCISLKS